MKEYTVGICIEDTIRAEDEIDAINQFVENISWKDCYAIEIKTEADKESE